MPLAAGNRWVYEYRNAQVQSKEEPPPDRSTRTIVASVVIDGKQWFQLEVIDWRSWEGIDQGEPPAYVLVRETPEGLFRYLDLAGGGYTQMPLIRKPVADGAQWTCDELPGFSWEITSTNETVQAMGQEITGCIHVVQHEPPEEGQTEGPVYEYWFKQGLGMVMDRYWPNPSTPLDEAVLLEADLAHMKLLPRAIPLAHLPR